VASQFPIQMLGHCLKANLPSTSAPTHNCHPITQRYMKLYSLHEEASFNNIINPQENISYIGVISDGPERFLRSNMATMRTFEAIVSKRNETCVGLRRSCHGYALNWCERGTISRVHGLANVRRGHRDKRA
jgi:hypothetical protein